MKYLFFLFLAFKISAFELPATSTQCIVGKAESWNSSYVTLQIFEKNEGKWVVKSPTWRGRLGKNGLVWGLGLHPVAQGSITKKEGDQRTPAGVFSIGAAWGSAEKITKHQNLSYRQVTPRDLWVEDPASDDYNKNVILRHNPKTDWEFKQQMKQNDFAHSLKMFIAHNASPNIIKGAGSSIFFHIWRNNGKTPSAGCTTMEEQKLKSLVASINPDRKPIYIIMPEAEYKKLKLLWKLP
jgi:L,D-peptidoglycan transpeptidase YkuD (ErfK/YbiS/YcfS/YnhG family)